jgi:hypothetical protein
MGYSQYSEHRRPTAVPKVREVHRDDATGEDELKLRKSFEKAIDAVAPKKPPKRSFEALLKRPKGR